jgi:NAD(P)-dependent dehydrogenase (short-subunit alcohol dehydrogenase family)
MVMAVHKVLSFVQSYSHLLQLRFALPELRKTKGRIVYATSGAGHDALFRGWGFYGMSKAAVEFEIKQLKLEEPNVTSIGISPGLCDTKMVGSLIAGKRKLT